MKKILFLFLMFIGLLSSLSASSGVTLPKVSYGDAEKSQPLGDGLAHQHTTLTVVNILHKDTLMSSWDEWQSLGSLKNDGHDETIVNKAVVCQPHGEIGV